MGSLIKKDEMKPTKERAITDLPLSAFLSVRGHQVLRIDGYGQRAFFVFEETPQLDRDCMDYFNRRAKVEPLAFSEVLRNFKALAIGRNRG